jgi:soluble lytic murein transglycosylase
MLRRFGRRQLACLLLSALSLAAAPAPPTLAALVRAYRQSPSPIRLAAIQTYAAAHPRDAALVDLGLGIAAYEQEDYPGAIARLRNLPARLPQVADYAAYYLAAARLEQNDAAAIAAQLAPVRQTAIPSPLAGKSWLLEARALQDKTPAEAVRILRGHYAALPQPDGALALADCYQASGDLAAAADFYQRVYYEYPAGDAAVSSAAALLSLKEALGAAYPPPLAAQSLHRAARLLALRDFAGARSEYQAALDLAAAQALEREQALVRLAAVDLAAGSAASAAAQLRALDLTQPEAAAERLYYLEECARRMDDDQAVLAAAAELREKYPQSPWRLKALTAAAGHFLAANRPTDYLPLYQTAYQDFPADPAAGLCHWRLAFNAYLNDAPDAEAQLRDHVRLFPNHPTAGAALYFLGRSAERRNDLSAARADYDRILAAFGNYYYASLAAERLTTTELRAAAPDESAAAFLAAIPFPAYKPLPAEPTRPTTLRIARSRVLRSAGLPDLADSELRFGAATDGQPVLLGMEMASAADSPHLAVHTMKLMAPDYLTLPLDRAPRQFWEFLFPLPYRDQLFAASRAHGVDPYLIAGLIRQESEFDPTALSHAGAYGLTQVRPVTGREFARRAGLQRFTTGTLLQPDANLKLGATILRFMLDRNNGSLVQTLAAYNAGPARVAAWVGWRAYREPAEFVESIPFMETRDYVQAVLRNTAMYRRLYK